MPAKYKQIGDFHEYYSGARIAPYLTVFIGGNHEASNHLFELYYGGWAAPNIYYMGAANVLRVGPLRIAGLSGIWKGYDYRKPHFERLPYNRDDTSSIYHVRELDVRKLLAMRTQVDVGLSHDWPQGVEWLGDHQELFKRKDLFEADANDGKLGSIAARQCLGRLRPPHWFSAHLHIKYPAVVKHPEYDDMSIPPLQNNRAPAVREEDRQQVSAWSQFHAQAQKTDAEDNERALKEQQSLREQEEKTGIRKQPNYTFNETFKQVKTDDNLGRAVTSVIKEDRPIDEVVKYPQLDGCIDSKPGLLKRRRQASDSDEIGVNVSDDEQPIHANEVDQKATGKRADTAASSTVVAVSPIMNPDAIDLDMSSDEDPPKVTVTSNRSVSPDMDGPEIRKEALMTSAAKNPDAIEVEFSDEEEPAQDRDTMNDNSRSAAMAIQKPKNQDATMLPGQYQDCIGFSSDPEEDGGMSLNPAASSFRPMASMASILQNEPRAQPSRSASHHSMEDLDLSKVPAEVNGREANNENAISDDMRAKLAALNPSFAQHEPVEKSPALSFPEGISNTITQFLALDKCERNRQFLQLLEIDVVSQEQGDSQSRPYKLQYDLEWLAILRVFAPELQVGGDPSDRVPHHRGETYYRQRIIEEEKYIRTHVIEAGLIDVPNNFSITAPVYDPNLQVDSRDIPREFTSPQTSAFCSMIGIENCFNITEEERDARIAQGARPEQQRFGGSRGRGGGRGGSNDRGGGRRGGNRGGRGGRGRGRW
jgi:lariat debranching enzyme